MSRYYRELHSRELLSQAESILSELRRRQLIEICVPCLDGELALCALDAAIRADGRLSLTVDRRFERTGDEQTEPVDGSIDAPRSPG